MDNAELAYFLGWCAVLNYSVLILWFLIFTFAHDWMFRLHGRWFDLKVGQFDVIHYAGIGLYKLLVFVFNLVPYLVLNLTI